jgi:cyclin L
MDSREDFTITTTEVQCTPSSRYGLSQQQETLVRIATCGLVQEAGILLRLPQVVMCTAQLLVQRFFFRKSLTKYDATVVAMGALFLASKLEENLRRSRTILNVFHRLRLRYEGRHLTVLDLRTTSYTEMKEKLFEAESALLIQMGFRVHCAHPYKFMLPFAKVIELETNREFLQTALNYINDSYRTPVHIIHRGQAIAVTALFMASRKLGIPLPERKGYEWWR